MDFKYSYTLAFSCPFLGRLCLRFYLVPWASKCMLVHWLDKYALSLCFFALSSFQGELVNVTSLRPSIFLVLGLSLLVEEIMRVRFMYHIH